MPGNELVIALFALVFLAFCLTAIALIAINRDKDDVADDSVSALRELHLGQSGRSTPKLKKDEEDDPPPE